jgi:N-acetyl-anhydromuramyl-L-alanine amidase AmpD
MNRTVWNEGWWRHARRVRSPNFGPRPDGMQITLAIVHSISLPPGTYGGDAVERFFTNRLDASEHPYFEQISALRVSAHFFIRRDGVTVQFVSCEQRAGMPARRNGVAARTAMTGRSASSSKASKASASSARSTAR